MPKAGIVTVVGKPNAGKSTLLNKLTGADVLAVNKLFATLDPTTRRLRLPTNQNVLLSEPSIFLPPRRENGAYEADVRAPRVAS